MATVLRIKDLLEEIEEIEMVFRQGPDVMPPLDRLHYLELCRRYDEMMEGKRMGPGGEVEWR